MSRVALVRGHHLSKEETVSYEPLKDRYAFTCFSTNNPWFDHSEIMFPIVTVPSVEGFFRWLPFNLGNRYFGAQDNLLGTGQWMPGLGRALGGYDLVHTSDYCHLFTYQIARAKRRCGYKMVAIHYENIPFAREDKPLVRATKRLIYEAVDGFFAMSERAREALLLEGVEPRKIFVIGNGVDTERFRPAPAGVSPVRQRYGIRDDEIVVLFVGRLHESKGVFELVHAAKKLFSDPEINPRRLRVVMVGRGKKKEALEQRIRFLGLENQVVLIGGVSHADIHQLHGMADIFTLPSIPTRYWQEQFGLVLIESMACGTPVVASLSGSIPEVVGDTGILVQPADHSALYEGLKTLIVDPDRRHEYAQRARLRAEQRFSLRVVSEKIASAYTTVLNGG